ncbi:MAG: UMP kinase [Oscillospiraceae bacterium]|jgi:uridylate kinase|nr:UMP kinase [Oscillospiraceae bacterium]
MSDLKYPRALLKLSGEVLAGPAGHGIDFALANIICGHIKTCVDAGAQLGVVIGGGNFWRGRSSGGMDAVHADQMGMLATMMNAIALADTLAQLGQPALVQAAHVMPQFAMGVNKAAALNALAAGKVVVFGGGTGNPFFTTDSCAALRAAEIEARVVLKATNVDGVYDSDPRKNPEAKKIDTLTHDEILARRLNVMDATAAALCRDKNIPMLVFNLNNPANILAALQGQNVGTLVVNEPKKTIGQILTYLMDKQEK